jgi:hypothetical protein
LPQRIFHKRKLGKDYDSTKNCLVLKQLVVIWGRQYCPIFEPFDDHRLTAPLPLLHLNIVWFRLNNSRAFHQLAPSASTLSAGSKSIANPF